MSEPEEKKSHFKFQEGKKRKRSILYSDNSLSTEFEELIYSFKLASRVVSKQIRKYINKCGRRFTNVVYLTSDCPQYMPKIERFDSPIDFMAEMRKQYPEMNFCLLIPILGLKEDTKITKKMSVEFDNNFFDLEKTSINFGFYAENKNWNASVYKFNKNEANIPVYGIYSPAFSYLKNAEELKIFDKMLMFMRSARIVIKNLYKENFKPDIVHSEVLPFFLGSEFEQKFPSNIKVFQVFDNFANMESDKQEPFWSVLNLADKQNMKKIYKDNMMQNGISRLFSLPIKDITDKMQGCINLIYDNYKIFHNSNSTDYNNKGDIIFRQLNNRIQKLFPHLFDKTEGHYYPFFKTLEDCDFWAVYSKTYYNDIFEQHLASPKILKETRQRDYKAGFVYPVVGNNEQIKIYNNFNNDNYREERIKNKKALVKEFSSDSIKTKFIDATIFKDFDSVKIYGYLDSFYDAPLLFANPELSVYNDGTDILFSTLLKLFERNRNIQIIISIKDGLKNDYIKSVVDFLEENQIFMGRWVFIDGEVNLPKILSASDMFLYPARLCDSYTKHMLGCHYGCVPVVSNAGILNDTVIDIFDNIVEGNGFKTSESLLYEKDDTNIYINCLEKALELYNNNHSSWNIIIKNDLNINTGWDFEKLEHYYEIYQNML